MRRVVAEPSPRRGRSLGWRWLRGPWPDRNPLRRGSDRLAALIVAATLLTFVAGAPVVALAAARWSRAAAVQVARAQHASWRQVPAVLLERAPLNVDIGYGGVALPKSAPAGPRRTGPCTRVMSRPPPEPGRAGPCRSGWTGRRPDRAPACSEQVTGQEGLAMVIAPFALGGILLCVSALALQAVDRRRLAAWDAEWRAFGPRWSSLR